MHERLERPRLRLRHLTLLLNVTRSKVCLNARSESVRYLTHPHSSAVSLVGFISGQKVFRRC